MDDEDMKIKELQKEIKRLRKACWIGFHSGRETMYELKVMFSFVKKLQGMVNEWEFKNHLFDSFYYCIVKEKLFDDEVDNILHYLQDEFDFRCYEWDEYVAFQREASSHY